MGDEFAATAIELLGARLTQQGDVYALEVRQQQCSLECRHTHGDSPSSENVDKGRCAISEALRLDDRRRAARDACSGVLGGAGETIENDATL